MEIVGTTVEGRVVVLIVTVIVGRSSAQGLATIGKAHGRSSTEGLTTMAAASLNSGGGSTIGQPTRGSANAEGQATDDVCVGMVVVIVVIVVVVLKLWICKF